MKKVNKKVQFVENVKMSTEAGKLCTIDGDTFYLFTKSTWIGDSGALCHIMNDDVGLFNVIKINKLIQGSYRNMPAMMKGKLCINIRQVNGTEWAHTLWPVKFCAKGINLFSLTFKVFQGNGIKNSHQNNISVESSEGNIILDHQIKTDDGWVVGVKFLHESSQGRAQSATAMHKKNINDLHVELGHPSEVITHDTMKAMSIQVTSTVKPCEDCILGKVKKSRVSKMAVACSKILMKKFFFNASSPSTPTFGGMKHWLLVMEDSSNYEWSFFLKEKIDF